MPLPFILGLGAVIAGAAGVGAGIHGAKKMKDANDAMKSAESRHNRNLERFEKQNKETTRHMDEVGKLELTILDSFKDFSDTFEKIHNRPNFKSYSKNGVDLPKYDHEKLKEVSLGANVLLGGLGGAGLGAAGGFAAAGATTAAVMALGTASTGTAIASLSGVAATNAALAALGGGALAVGGGGMALGTAVLGASTLGIGLLVGGIVFNITGSSISKKAEEAESQMRRSEREIDKTCSYMLDLSDIAIKYNNSLASVNKIYQYHLEELKRIVLSNKKTDWASFSGSEKIITENTSLLVGLLYSMCKVELVSKAKEENALNTINTVVIEGSINKAKQFMQDRGLPTYIYD